MLKLMVLLALALAGCASDAELAMRDDAKCVSYGAAMGSPATAIAGIPGSRSDNTPQPEHTRWER